MLDSIRLDHTASNRKRIDPSRDRSVFQFQERQKCIGALMTSIQFNRSKSGPNRAFYGHYLLFINSDTPYSHREGRSERRSDDCTRGDFYCL